MSRMTLIRRALQEMNRTTHVGVDLGSAFLKGVEISRLNGRAALHRCEVVDLAGVDAVQALKGLGKRAGWNGARVAVGIASPEVVVKPFRFPRMPMKELRAAVSLEAEQAILNGHTMAEMTLDWHLLETKSKEFMQGLCAVIPKNVLSSRMQKVKAAGIRPVVVDVEALAVWNAWWTLAGEKIRQGAGSDPRKGDAELVINVGARTTNLVIARGGNELILMRDFQMGAQALAQGLEKEWVTEVRDSIRYARSKSSDWELDSVQVTGGGSGRVDLAALSEVAGVAAQVWNPLDHLKSEGKTDVSIGPMLSVAIGLALRSGE